MRRVGSDTGGTFTDLVLDDGTIAKVPSTADDPGAAVRAGIAALLGDDGRARDGIGGGDGTDVWLGHGTTVATNALLERRGARVALVTNAGFADIIEIARQDRPSLYDQRVDRPEPLVDRRWRYEVPGRTGPDGAELEPLDPSAVPVVDDEVEAVAVCLLHSDLGPGHEQVVAEVLRGRGLDVTASHELAPEMREYERTVTAVVNAYVRPVCRRYLTALAGAVDTVAVMSSAAGLMDVNRAADQPARLLLSGPAGGVLAGAAIAEANGWPDALTFDMGGTSTDVCLVLDGRPEPAAAREVAGLPVRLPALDIHTIGAGGGSIARIDDGGALVVGPDSAGARPGPACYGHGGTEPTVTDANVLAGRIPADATFPGLGRPDLDAARRAFERTGLEPAAVLAVVDANMVQALRRVSIERGVDPRGLALVAFGGAGPLHACALADALEMRTVVVPPRAGVFSAVGILGAPRQVDLVRSWPTPLDHTGLDVAVDELTVAACNQLQDATIVTNALDCRYAGQSHELRVASVDAFEAEHERRNGYARPGTPIEVVAVRVTAQAPSPVTGADLPTVERASALGPSVIAEPDCTIFVADGWRAEPGAAGALVLRRSPSSGF